MRKFLNIVCSVLIIAFMTAGCGGDDAEPDVKQLWITLDGDVYGKRFFDRAGSGSRSEVWVEQGMNVSGDTVNAVIAYFDGTVYPTVTTNFAANYDANGDGRTAIVIFAGQTSSTYIAGYMSIADFYSNAANSNRWDGIYLNGAHMSHLPGSAAFNNTLAHEFQHLCNFSRNVIVEHGGDYNYMMYTWIDEGLSENAGAMCAGLSSNYSRITHYATDDDIRKGNRSVAIWESSLDNYDLVYIFMGYLRGRFGDSILRAIIERNDDANSNGTCGLNAVLCDYNSGKDVNELFKEFLIHLKEKTYFPTGFFPSSFTVPTYFGSGSLRTYAFVYGSLSATSNDLTYLNNDGDVITSGTAVAAVFLDKEGSTWKTENKTEAAVSFSVVSTITSSVLRAALRTVGGEEEGRTDMILLPEGISGPVVGSEEDTAGEGY